MEKEQVFIIARCTWKENGQILSILSDIFPSTRYPDMQIWQKEKKREKQKLPLEIFLFSFLSITYRYHRLVVVFFVSFSFALFSASKHSCKWLLHHQQNH
jgi:hypothetical protein